MSGAAADERKRDGEPPSDRSAALAAERRVAGRPKHQLLMGHSVTDARGEIVESWPFADTPNTASITTRQVLEGAPILLVTHDADDGSWQLLCGTTDDPADARIVGLGAMYKRDPTLGELADLPEGWRASRASAGQPWHRGPA